jgi:hypothetical protein
LQLHPADRAAKDRLRSYLERKAKNGLVKEATQSKIAWMYWQV